MREEKDVFVSVPRWEGEENNLILHLFSHWATQMQAPTLPGCSYATTHVS